MPAPVVDPVLSDRFAPPTRRSIERQLGLALAEAEARSTGLRADAARALEDLDLSDFFDGEVAPSGVDEQARTVALAAEADHAVQELRAAQERWRDGTYGWCYGAIPLARLRALPATRHCVQCKASAADPLQRGA